MHILLPCACFVIGLTLAECVDMGDAPKVRGNTRLVAYLFVLTGWIFVVWK